MKAVLSNATTLLFRRSKCALLTFFIGATSGRVTAQIHTWTVINTGYRLQPTSAPLITTDHCIYYFSTNYSTLIRSVDRGMTWDSIYVPSDSSFHEYVSMCFVNDSVGFLAGYDGSHHLPNSHETSVVKKTTDRGQTWQLSRNGIIDNSLPTHINFFDQNNGILFGTADFSTQRFITQDGGANWTFVQESQPTSPQISIHMVKKSSFAGHAGFVSGFNINGLGLLGRSTDLGQTWTTNTISTVPVNELRLFDSMNGVVSVQDSLLVTTDGAQSFISRRKFPYATFITAFDMIDMSQGFVCTLTDIYYTPDAGATWSLSYSGTAPILDLNIQGNYAYAAAFNDSLVLKLDISAMTGLTDIQNQPGLYLYPNPANEQVYVRAGNEVVKSAGIWDQLGRLVQVASPVESPILNVSGLSPGVYTLGVYTGSRKLYTKLIITTP